MTGQLQTVSFIQMLLIALITVTPRSDKVDMEAGA